MAESKQKIDVSIVVPTLNSIVTIERCINSLLSQEYPKYRFEIIAVDNGSVDGTLDKLKRFRDDILVLHEPNKGSYHARNRGIRHAKGRFILFTDADCFADQYWIKEIISSFSDTNVKIAAGPIKAANKRNTIQEYFDLFCHNQEEYCRQGLCATSNMAVRKDDLLEAGMFNTQLMSGGDFEICSRLVKDKNDIRFVAMAKVQHQYIDSLSEFMKKSFYYGKWNKFMRHNLDLYHHIPMPSYIKIFRSYGLRFIFLKVLQDISYRSGLYFSNTRKNIN